MGVQILDCTLRDGGYVNNWEFGRHAIASILDKLEAGGVDCLASFSAEPLENIQGFEEVPTCSELGYDIDFRMFRGLAGAPGMSDAALTYWQEVCRQVSEDPAWTEDYLLARGLTPAFIIGDDLTAFMEDQYETYYNAQKELGLM